MNRVLDLGRFLLLALLVIGAWLPAAIRATPGASHSPAAATEAVETPETPIPASRPEQPAREDGGSRVA